MKLTAVKKKTFGEKSEIPHVIYLRLQTSCPQTIKHLRKKCFFYVSDSIFIYLLYQWKSSRCGNFCEFREYKKFANISYSVFCHVLQGTILLNHRFRRFANISTREVFDTHKYPLIQYFFCCLLTSLLACATD